MAEMEVAMLNGAVLNPGEEASKEFRTATALTVFFIITTDILGPANAPFAFSQLGYVPGAFLYTGLGFVAGYTGWILWKLYLTLNTAEDPLKNFCGLALKIFGKEAYKATNFLQSLQLLFNVALIILGNAQGMSQIVKGQVCFSALGIIWMVIGIAIGQIKQLSGLTSLSNFAIWMNMSVIFITMGVVANTAPNYDAALSQSGEAEGPVVTSNFPTTPLTAQVVGMLQMVYAYGGAMMFVEIMAEMKDPREFIKSFAGAQSFIIICYMVFGLVVYHYQGQFTINPANQGMSPYSWQTAANVLNLSSALIAAVLYGNIGMKVFYQSMIVEVFRGPPLASEAGSKIWIPFTMVYWAFAFILSSAIPQISNISGLVAALCILQFTYTFPPLLMLGYEIQRDALLAEKSENPELLLPGTEPLDTWWQFSRWHRGISEGGPTSMLRKIINLLIFLGGLATAGLGIYSSIVQIIAGFEQPHAATSFGCASPV